MQMITVYITHVITLKNYWISQREKYAAIWYLSTYTGVTTFKKRFIYQTVQFFIWSKTGMSQSPHLNILCVV